MERSEIFRTNSLHVQKKEGNFVYLTLREKGREILIGRPGMCVRVMIGLKRIIVILVVILVVVVIIVDVHGISWSLRRLLRWIFVRFGDDPVGLRWHIQIKFAMMDVLLQ